jgi:hypothetical protein
MLIKPITKDMPFDKHVNQGMVWEWAFNHLYQHGHLHIIKHFNQN